MPSERNPVGALVRDLPGFVKAPPVSAVVLAWGVNEDGQLGLASDRQNVAVPKVVEAFLGMQMSGRTLFRASLVAGSRCTLAIGSDGLVWAWGWNERATLGLDHRQNVQGPTCQRSLALARVRIKQVAVNGWHGLAVSEEGTMYAWGGNEYSQCAVPAGGTSPEALLAARTVPRPVAILTHLRVAQVACGGMHSLALTETGKLVVWGEPWGDFSMCADRQPREVDITAMQGARVGMIAAGAFHNMALTETGQVFTWGTNDYGQLGNGHTSYDTKPQHVPIEGVQVADICAGGWHSLALTVAGEVWAWGRGEYGRLGIGDRSGSSKLRPHKVRALEGHRIVQVAAGGTHTLALSDRGRLWSWGRAAFGRLGVAFTKEVDAYLPVDVDMPGGRRRWFVVSIAAGGRHSMCLAVPRHKAATGPEEEGSDDGLQDGMQPEDMTASERSVFDRDVQYELGSDGFTNASTVVVSDSPVTNVVVMYDQGKRMQAPPPPTVHPQPHPKTHFNLRIENQGTPPTPTLIQSGPTQGGQGPGLYQEALARHASLTPPQITLDAFQGSGSYHSDTAFSTAFGVASAASATVEARTSSQVPPAHREGGGSCTSHTLQVLDLSEGLVEGSGGEGWAMADESLPYRASLAPLQPPQFAAIRTTEGGRRSGTVSPRVGHMAGFGSGMIQGTYELDQGLDITNPMMASKFQQHFGNEHDESEARLAAAAKREARRQARRVAAVAHVMGVDQAEPSSPVMDSEDTGQEGDLGGTSQDGDQADEEEETEDEGGIAAQAQRKRLQFPMGEERALRVNTLGASSGMVVGSPSSGALSSTLYDSYSNPARISTGSHDSMATSIAAARMAAAVVGSPRNSMGLMSVPPTFANIITAGNASGPMSRSGTPPLERPPGLTSSSRLGSMGSGGTAPTAAMLANAAQQQLAWQSVSSTSSIASGVGVGVIHGPRPRSSGSRRSDRPGLSNHEGGNARLSQQSPRPESGDLGSLSAPPTPAQSKQVAADDDEFHVALMASLTKPWKPSAEPPPGGHS